MDKEDFTDGDLTYDFHLFLSLEDYVDLRPEAILRAVE